MTRPLVLGVTGNIACGKSTVLAMLAERGAATLDADAIYHELIDPSMPLTASLRRRFGDRILAADGSIDRRALGRLVFADPVAMADLDALTHPAVVAEVRRRIRTLKAPVIAIDAVKLVESGLADDCDRLWLVTCSPDVQVERLMARNGIERVDAERRVAAQPPLADKVSRADAVIDNGADLTTTRAQVDRAWRALCDPGGEGVSSGVQRSNLD